MGGSGDRANRFRLKLFLASDIEGAWADEGFDNVPDGVLQDLRERRAVVRCDESNLKWIGRIAVALLLMGCGGGEAPMVEDSSPTGNTFNFLTLNEFEDYLVTMQVASNDVGLMVSEFTSLTNDLDGGAVSGYWLSEFTRNLLRRLDDVKARATSLRPEHPTLLEAHVTDYEGALEDYEIAFNAFLAAISSPGTVATGAVNTPITAGNVHLARFDQFLSGLRGGRVSLFGAGVTTVGP